MEDEQLKELLKLLGIFALIILGSIVFFIIAYWVGIVLGYVIMCILCPCCAPTWDDYMRDAK